VFLLALIATWETISRLGIYSPVQFPSPGAVGAALFEGLRDGSLLIATAASMRRILIGFGASLVLGILLGWFIARSPVVEDTLGRLVLSLQTVPSIAWLPLALLWFGLDEKAILFVVLLGATLPITISVESGIRGIPLNQLRVARMMGTQPVQMLRWVTIPACIPALTVGMRNAWAFAWRSLMAGELLVATVGLGQVLTLARDLNDMARVFAVIFIIGVLGYAIDQGFFRRLEAHVAARWDVAPR
jgi:NitT/TauT family transport system permease protein